MIHRSLINVDQHKIPSRVTMEQLTSMREKKKLTYLTFRLKEYIIIYIEVLGRGAYGKVVLVEN